MQLHSLHPCSVSHRALLLARGPGTLPPIFGFLYGFQVNDYLLHPQQHSINHMAPLLSVPTQSLDKWNIILNRPPTPVYFQEPFEFCDLLFYFPSIPSFSSTLPSLFFSSVSFIFLSYLCIMLVVICSLYFLDLLVSTIPSVFLPSTILDFPLCIELSSSSKQWSCAGLQLPVSWPPGNCHQTPTTDPECHGTPDIQGSQIHTHDPPAH